MVVHSGCGAVSNFFTDLFNHAGKKSIFIMPPWPRMSIYVHITLQINKINYQNKVLLHSLLSLNTHKCR